MRTEIADLERILVPTKSGAKVPLGQLAAINRVMGPAMINSTNGIPRPYVLMNVRGRDVMGFKSFRDLGIIALGLPLSIAGGLLLQVALGYNFSVAVWVGYIALLALQPM